MFLIYAGGKSISRVCLIMSVLRRPILVGGVGLSFALWLLQSLHHSMTQLGEIGVLSIIAVGGILWSSQRRTENVQIEPNDLPLDRATVEKAIAQAESIVNQLEAEHKAPSLLQERIAQLNTDLDRQEIHLAITGGKAVGKTTLSQVLSTWIPNQQPLSLRDTPALFTGTDAGLTAETAALEAALASDLVLFVTDGDLTEPEFQALQQLATANRNTVLVFNKQDQYLPEERATVLFSLQQRMQSRLEVVMIAASPKPVKVRQHQSDGSVREWTEQPVPDTKQLTDQLTQILVQDRQQLVWATTKRAAVALKAEGKTVLNGVRRDRALPVIEQYQWIAAAAAFANPVPVLDLLTTAAINGQLVMDLGAIYQQRFSLQQAQTAAGTLGNLMLKLGLVELSTQTISGILKSNAITFVAGGAVQGVSAAYLTRLAGMSLIEYFQEQDASTTEAGSLNFDRLAQTLQRVFQQNQRVLFLQSFAKQAVERLSPKLPQPELISSDLRPL